jgi:spore maturation protein CgeB
MKILLAGPQDKTVLGFIAKDCWKTLETLGHEVAVFDFRKRPYAQGRFVSGFKRYARALLPFLPSPYEVFGDFKKQVDRKINQELERLAFNFQPDLVLVLLGENLDPETLEKIRKLSSHPAIVNWFHDTLLLDYRRRLLESVAPAYDIIFLIDSAEIFNKVAVKVKKTVVLPLGCNPLVHKKLDLSDKDKEFYGSDVAFVGTVSPQREKWLEQLAGDFDLKIWGRWQKKSGKLACCYQNQDTYAQDAVKIYNASKIILDFHSLWQKEESIYNVTPRVFEVPACGGFLLTNFCLQIKDFYSIGEEMIVYRDMEELKRLIGYYLAHEGERKDIARKAYVKARSEHTMEKRLSLMLENVRGLRSCRA